MSEFKITKDSVEMLGDKTCMEVTFKADDGREVTNYHEVESLDKDVIEQELQKTADAFNKKVEVKKKPVLQEDKFISVELN